MQLPSPNPKHGIMLSSSKDDNVCPIIDIACSYGFGSFPMWCKLRRLNDLEPTMRRISTCHKTSN